MKSKLIKLRGLHVMRNLLLLSLISALCSFNIEINNNFIGKWVGENSDEIGYIIFDKDGYALMEAKNQVLGGKEFLVNGQKGKMTYEINSKVKPIQVDLIITNMETGGQKKILCIAEFKDNNNMIFAMSLGTQRTKEFNNKNSVLLKRVE